MRLAKITRIGQSILNTASNTDDEGKSNRFSQKGRSRAPTRGSIYKIIVGQLEARGEIANNISLVEQVSRFVLRAGMNTFFCALCLLLLAAWLASDPAFRLHDRIKRSRNRKIVKNKLARIPKRQLGRVAVVSSVWAAMTIWSRAAESEPQTSQTGSPPDSFLPLETRHVWKNGVGMGFEPGLQSISLDFGAGQGVEIFGGRESHDVALASISYGRSIGSLEGKDHWYRGNWEFRAELFSGAQFSPTWEWLVGITPHLRYNFATGTRWIPYVDVGAGVSATSIGPPDLSHYFEFNLQASSGVRWFIRDNFALGIEVRYLHMSCAGINSPNLGLNNVNGMAGATWFF